MIDYNTLATKAGEMILAYAPKVLLAIITLIIGLWIIKRIAKLIELAMEKQDVDPSLRHFLASLIGMGLKVLLIIAVISMLGVETTSFVAVLAAAGFAVGLALQGSLSNFAGGVLILLFKPFKVGDFIETVGYMGNVNKIDILNTVLKTPDNKTIIIPNGQVSNAAITNFSTEKERRMDLVFGIGYNDNIDSAKKIILDYIKKDNRILKDPEPFVRTSSLSASSVDITVRAWVKSADYWNVHFDMLEKIKVEFDKKGISIPFPQTDVHLYKHTR